MRTFDYSFLREYGSGEVIQISNTITDLKVREEMRKRENGNIFEKLQQRAIVASVKSSSALSGIRATDERIEDIMNGAIPLSHDELEISGYKDALFAVHSSYADLDFDEKFILDMHRMILGDTSPVEAGHYKTSNNLVLGPGAEGKRKVLFHPVDADKTQEAMRQLILAYMDAARDSRIPPMLLIPCVVLDFLCIYPFTDGNGRVSRLLTILLLYRHGYDIGRYISIEKQINACRDSYYSALKEASGGWEENRNDYSPFISFSLQILYRCYRLLDESFAGVVFGRVGKSERVAAVVLDAAVPISKAEIADKLPDVSVKTIELVLGNLKKEGKIQKTGSYRNARYMRVRKQSITPTRKGIGAC